MNAPRETYDRLGGLLEYPAGDYGGRVEAATAAVARTSAEAASEMAAFEAETARLRPEEFEELFTRTFDLNPDCCLEVGWQLFGDKYDRGSFMVWMRGQLRTLEVRESDELPDHVSHVLPVLARMEKKEADRFSRDAVLPALEKMLVVLKGKKNPFEHVLKATQIVLTSNHGPSRTKAGTGRGFDLSAGMARRADGE